MFFLQSFLGKDQGLNLARQFNNCSFMETSAKAKIGVKDVSIFKKPALVLLCFNCCTIICLKLSAFPRILQEFHCHLLFST